MLSLKLRTFLVKNLKISNQEVAQLLVQNRVLLNGNSANGSDSVSEKDEVCVDGKTVQEKKKYSYIRFYKPRGIESTLNKNIPDNLTILFKHPKKLYPIGRLDKESEGLLLLTDDGAFYKQVTQSNNKVEKEYLVSVNKIITKEFLATMRKGVVMMEIQITIFGIQQQQIQIHTEQYKVIHLQQKVVQVLLSYPVCLCTMQ